MTLNTVDDLIRARSALDPFGRPSSEQVRELAKAREALNAEARDRWEDERWHREVAALIASRLDYGFVFENLFSTYFEVRTVGEFETVELRERRGLRVFWTARGGYIDESQLRTERWELPRDTIGFHVSEFEDKLRANFAETIEELVGLAEQRLDAEVNRRMFNLLQAAVPSSSPYYVDATSGVDAAVLNDSITAVADAVKPTSGGRIPPITIAGRAAMVDQVSDAVQGTGIFDPQASEEIRRMGYLGSYRGANIVRVKNYVDDNGDSYIPDNELWVFGGTVGLFAKYGGLRTKSWDENTVDYRHYRGRCDVGGLVHHPEQARRIVVP